ncbi:MAG: glycolate oxidase subunit GlcE [Alphaproteobacteria bacterium]|nr:glycolate oxidase subunit GlcE [Alphaproteobacteria bacterium]
MTPAPADEGELIAALADDQGRFELLAGGTKRDYGRPVAGATPLSLARFSGIRAYEPEELVLTCGAATPLAEIEALLATKSQMLAFEPPDWRALWGASGRQTLGGVLACNLGGPRRIKAGAARDHLLGFRAVSGHAQAFKAGGRVVKNVTGYDLCKIMCGSFGTLAALTEVTVKVLPAPETARTLAVEGLDDGAAIALLARAAGSPLDVSGLAHLPRGIADVRALTALRLEGTTASVAARLESLERLAEPHGALARLDHAASQALWRKIGDAEFLCRHVGPLWRVSIAPSHGPRYVAALKIAGARHYYDWSGGLVWLALPPAPGAHAAMVRGALAPLGGHATLIRAEAAIRTKVPVFEPEAPGLAALARRLKDSFDPERKLNPGRMTSDA